MWLALWTACICHVAVAVVNDNPPAGTCFEVTGSGVNARSSHSLTAHVITTLNYGEFHKYNGGKMTKDGYIWYQLQDIAGGLAWVAGNFLTKTTSSHCSGTHSSSGQVCIDTVAKDYACKILDFYNKGRISLASVHPSGRHDNAYSVNNIRDACNGHAVSRSHYSCNGCLAPGGHVCLHRELLQYIYEIAEKRHVLVNEIAGACHTCNSRHYRGMAVDLHNDAGTSFYVKHCNSMPHGVGFEESGTHVHCQFNL